MILFLLAYVGGVLTILSPCILPVLPFVFSRAELPFRRNGLPLLSGMALTFAGVSTLAVVGGGWAVHANEWGRVLALGFLSLFALTLLFPSIAEWLSRPLLRLGGRLQSSGPFWLGAATGLLWAPCAGPILGLILTGAALRGAMVSTGILLLAYALGAATSLALALIAGGRLLKTMKGYLGYDRGVRRLIGTAVLVGVLAIALGWDRGTLTSLSRVHTESIEQKLVGWLHPETTPAAEGTHSIEENRLPDFSGATGWINSAPLTPETLRGKVVLIDFWTYSCINCLRTLPYVKAWYQKYKDSGLVVIGVHTPEFAFEKNPANVEKAVHDLGVSYPVVMDSRYAIWDKFNNRYWPAHYFVDAEGRIRGHHFGEGEYDESEAMIQKLLAEARAGRRIPSGIVQVQGPGAQAAGRSETLASGETYVGYERSENLVTQPPVKRDQTENYTALPSLSLNQWSLVGHWLVGPENATLDQAPGKILYRFHARDLHLVLGPGSAGRSIRIRVRLDGQAPLQDHGVDVNEAGEGMIRAERLYQLIRQNEPTIRDRLFEIEFLDPGAQAFAFTFG